MLRHCKDHINVPCIAAPPKHLFVLRTEKIIPVPELVRRSVGYHACGGGNILLAPALRGTHIT
jgi:hypothetical protein